MRTGDCSKAVCRTHLSLALCVALCLALGACHRGQTSAKLDPDLARSVAEKKAEAKRLADAERNSVSPDIGRFFELVEHNDWPHATNVFARLQQQAGMNATSSSGGFWQNVSQMFSSSGASPYAAALRGPLWCPVLETYGAAEVFHDWDNALLHRFGQDIIDSIPTNSIYFGGTDPGRFIITALSPSHREGRPFYTLTQNGLADGRYLDYLRGLYGARLYIPTTMDMQTAFSSYLADAQKRLQAGKLMPGEDVKVDNNRVQVSGQVAVMQINGLLAKIIFENNTNHEFYLEESFPLDWMYPYLSPHGLILKLNREPLPDLPAPALQTDHAYWQKYVGQLLGDWLKDDTTVPEVCAFADRVFLRKDLKGFTGNPAYVQNDAAHKAFSKLRSSIGGLYAWRYAHSDNEEERTRLRPETDFAFRQAFALCPYSPEAVFRYVDFLVKEQRTAEALLVAQTCQRLDPSNAAVSQLVQHLKSLPATAPAKGGTK